MEEETIQAARRRNRLLLSSLFMVFIFAGGGTGAWFWYQSTLPEPHKAYLSSAVIAFKGSLASVELPEELPETLAEIEERKSKKRSEQAARNARIERAQIAKEKRLAASSELQMGSGTGQVFDRVAFSKAISSRNSKLTACLQGEARRDPKLKSLGVKITVIPKGRLINIHLSKGSKHGNRCVRKALGGLRVPPFDGTNVKVNLPFDVR